MMLWPYFYIFPVPVILPVSMTKYQVDTWYKFNERNSEWMTKAYEDSVDTAKNFICIN